MKYSQNDEEKYINEYFKKDNGLFLEIGGYDPFLFSNTRKLVERGWSGVVMEPSPIRFESFVKEYGDNKNMVLLQYALGKIDGKIAFYDSKGDAISSTSIEHVEKWVKGYNCEFDKIEVDSMSPNTLFRLTGFKFDFINIDVEGTNLEILDLINDNVWDNCSCVCIEHDSNFDYIIKKLSKFGYKEIHRNGENLILAK